MYRAYLLVLVVKDSPFSPVTTTHVNFEPTIGYHTPNETAEKPHLPVEKTMVIIVSAYFHLIDAFSFVVLEVIILSV